MPEYPHAAGNALRSAARARTIVGMKNKAQLTNSLAQIFAKLPLISLLVCNAIPLIGVLFLGWDAFLIVLLYWAENVAVGFYNVLKMAAARVGQPAAHLGKLFAIPFFIVHYSGFTGVHGVFILAMFKKDPDIVPGGDAWPCFLVFVQMLCGVIRQAWLEIPNGARWVVLAMFISHGVSFGYNYLYKREYAAITPDKLMVQPYGRIIVMHVAILFGGFLTMSMGSPIGLLVILIVLKTVIDLKLHNRQHQTIAAQAARAA
jgi:hypothetical protein